MALTFPWKDKNERMDESSFDLDQRLLEAGIPMDCIIRIDKLLKEHGLEKVYVPKLLILVNESIHRIKAGIGVREFFRNAESADVDYFFNSLSRRITLTLKNIEDNLKNYTLNNDDGTLKKGIQDILFSYLSDDPSVVAIALNFPNNDDRTTINERKQKVYLTLLKYFENNKK